MLLRLLCCPFNICVDCVAIYGTHIMLSFYLKICNFRKDRIYLL